MSVDESPISSEAAFQRELTSLFRRAHDGGVQVKGGWACRNGEEIPDWDVVVTELRKDSPTE